MPDTNDTLIFVHIPKTAGSTLNSVLSRHYSAAVTYRIYGSDADGIRLVDQLSKMPAERKKPLALVRGHWPYGLHESLPHPSRYISLMRHPVERVVSFYYHVLRTPQHYAYREGFSPGMDLRAFVEKGFAERETQNGQTYFLTGERPALQALQQTVDKVMPHYAFVGISERFDESLLLLKRILGWGNVFYYSRRVNPRRPRLKAVPPYERAAIAERNLLDIQLYSHFQEVLQRQIDAQGPSFQREIRVFRIINGIFERFSLARRQAARWKPQLAP